MELSINLTRVSQRETTYFIAIVIYSSEIDKIEERKHKNRESAIKSRKKKRELMETLQSDWDRLTKVGIYLKITRQNLVSKILLKKMKRLNQK